MTSFYRVYVCMIYCLLHRYLIQVSLKRYLTKYIDKNDRIAEGFDNYFSFKKNKWEQAFE